MRTEAKLALLLVLVLVVVAAIYFARRVSDRTIVLEKPERSAPSGSVPLPGVSRAAPTPRQPAEPAARPPAGLGPAATGPSVLTARRVTPPSQPGEPRKSAYTIAPREVASRPVTTAPATRPSGLGPAGREVTMIIQPNAPARIEPEPRTTKPVPAPVGEVRKPEPEEKMGVYVVREGDTLFDIAQVLYDRGDLWPLIVKANPGLDPKRLKPGQKLRVPSRAQADAEHTQTTMPTPAGAERAALRTYTVQRGDSFYSIAEKELGSGNRWKELHELNKAAVGGDPSELKAGQTIFLPKK